MKHTISSEWKGGLEFESDVDGHKVITDAPIANNGQDRGPSPKKLQLVALAGCTGMDVISILKKMRVNVEKYNVIVEGEMREEHPKYYERMHIIYEFGGKDLPIEKLKKAIKLSEETYCGVEALYRKAIEVTSEIRILQ